MIDARRRTQLGAADGEGVLMQLKINERSVYAPIRYEATRPYAAKLGEQFLRQSNRGREARKAHLLALQPVIGSAVSKLGRVSGPEALQEEIINVQLFGYFQDAGKIIYDVARPLTEALIHTDADDIPCSALKFPFPSLYLHFGTFSGLADETGGIEGAFVTHHVQQQRLMIALVPVGFGQRNFFRLATGEAVMAVSVDLSDGLKSVTKALADSIEEILQMDAKTRSTLAEIERPAPGAGPTKTYFTGIANKEPLLKKGLGLIVNTLFFILAEPGDAFEDWGSDVPRGALRALKEAGKPEVKKTLENTLAKAFYVKVRYLGQKFASSGSSREFHEAISSGRVLSTHIRRGHYRWQHYGPELALVKHILIRPVVVNAWKGELQGRIYQVT